MTVKSILEIELLGTEEFQKFQEDFDRYTKKLAAMPGIWGKSTAEQKKFFSTFDQHRDAFDAWSKLGDTTQKLPQSLSASMPLWTSIAGVTKSIAGNILSATGSLLKWGSILGGAGLAGAAVLAEMSGSVSRTRRATMGFGMSAGQYRAFGLNFGRITDPDQYLSWINSMETDASEQGAAYSLIGGLSGDTTRDATAMLRAERALAQRTSLSFLGPTFRGRGLEDDPEFQRRLKTMSDSEFSGLLASFGKDKQKLDYSDKTAQNWTNLNTQLERAGAQISKTLIMGLEPLVQPLGNLTKSAVQFAETFAQTDLFKDSVRNASSALDVFAAKLGSPALLDTVTRIGSKGSLGTDFVEAMENPVQTFDKARAFLVPTSADIKKYPALLGRVVDRANMQWGLPIGFLQTIQGLEHSGTNAVSPQGAMGTFQLMPNTWAAYKGWGATNPFDPLQNLDASARFAAHLNDKFHGDVAKMVAAYHAGETTVAAAENQAAKNHTDWTRYIGPKDRQYLLNSQPLLQAYGNTTRVDVNVTAPPGFNVSTTVNSLAPH